MQSGQSVHPSFFSTNSLTKGALFKWEIIDYMGVFKAVQRLFRFFTILDRKNGLWDIFFIQYPSNGLF